jgi:hypothetical protein
LGCMLLLLLLLLLLLSPARADYKGNGDTEVD